ncbi:MAG: ATP-binding protein, partial [Cyanobacteria bacterium J06592_8]
FLCDCSPSEIAAELHRDCNGLRVDWSRGLYRYIETLTGKSIKSWKDIVILLAEYRSHTPVDIPKLMISTTSLGKIDCCEAVDASVFYGRETELTTLKQWMVEERCRVVAVRGMAGMGKTKLVSKLIPSLQTEFDYIIWRNLSHAPPLIQVLADLIEFLSDKQDKKLENWRVINQSIKMLTQSFISAREKSRINSGDQNLPFFHHQIQPQLIAEGIRELIKCLQQHRCLIILDGWEALFQPQTFAGKYRPGYEGYGQFLKQIGKLNHQSCLLLTTTEVPKTVTYLSDVQATVRTLTLGSLGQSASRLLQKRGLLNEVKYSDLIKKYNGNPQALQIVSKTINQIFGNRVDEFLARNSQLFLGDFRERIAEQFNRLSTVEKQTLLTLATVETPISLKNLTNEFKSDSTVELMKALESLERRSLISMIQGLQDTFYQPCPLIQAYIHKNLNQKKLNDLLLPHNSNVIIAEEVAIAKVQ